MPSFEGKHGSIEPRLAPVACRVSSLVKSEKTRLRPVEAEGGEVAGEERRHRVHVEHARHADA